MLKFRCQIYLLVSANDINPTFNIILLLCVWSILGLSYPISEIIADERHGFHLASKIKIKKCTNVEIPDLFWPNVRKIKNDIDLDGSDHVNITFHHF